MPYENEHASGDSLWRFIENESVQQFRANIRIRNSAEPHEFPSVITPPRGFDRIRTIIAIDGSNVTYPVQNGFPKAEASLLNVAAIIIDVAALKNAPPDRPIRPRDLRAMEQVRTMSAVLPGPNVTGFAQTEDTAKKFFRSTVRKELNFKPDPQHESLLDTFLEITSNEGRAPSFQCPLDDCDLAVPRPTSDTTCRCGREEPLYPSDSLRTHERFYEEASSEQAFSWFRQITEHLLMVNILRFFHQHCEPQIFEQIAFIIDGPLAIFGGSAWLKAHIQDEVARIHQDLVSRGHEGLLLMGIEKTGQFRDHLEELDWLQTEGPRQRLENSVALAPTTEYIYRHIKPEPDRTKPFGRQTHYGRNLMYKNTAGQHAILLTPMVNTAGRNWNDTSLDAFPRLGEALDIIDELYTHIYLDGFIPLVRAHAHAAIPLRAGQRILDTIFGRE